MPAPTDLQLAEQGRGIPREGLLEQVRVTLVRAEKYATQLAKVGWKASDTQALKDAATHLESLREDQETEADDAHESVQTAAVSASYAKQFIHRLDLNLPYALEETPSTKLTLHSFARGEALGRVPSKIREYLVRIRPRLAELDDVLTDRFEGEKPTSVLDWCVAHLDSAQTDKHTKLADLPKATLTVYTAKGDVLRRLKRLDSAGRTAFQGDAARAADFNRDILLHARHARAKTTATPPVTPPPASVQPTPPPASAS